MIGEKGGEFRGKTVETAVSAGLAALRLTRDQVDIEVIRPGSRGVLGIGAEDAVVRLTPRKRVESRPSSAPPAPKPPPPAPVLVQPEPKPAPAPQPTPPEAPEPTRASQPVLEALTQAAPPAVVLGKELLEGLLARMNLDADVEIKPQSDAEADEGDRMLVLNIVGDDLGMLIGRQNEVLSALEFITRLMVNQQSRTRSNFIIDVNGYRAKRAESLHKLALRMADQVVPAGRTMALEPMSPAERRIIHLALRDHPGVTTHSVGEGDRRKVTIIPKRD